MPGTRTIDARNQHLTSIPDAAREHRTVAYRLLTGSRAGGRKLAAVAGASRYVWNMLKADQESL